MSAAEPQYLTVKDVAELFRTSPETVRYWAWQGTGPKSFKVGRRRLYAREDVEEFIAAARAQGDRVPLVLVESDRDFVLSSGPTEGLTDQFLRDVARAYAAALARGERPNRAIATQTGCPLKTVQRWVLTARQHGLMPPAPSQGKAG